MRSSPLMIVDTTLGIGPPMPFASVLPQTALLQQVETNLKNNQLLTFSECHNVGDPEVINGTSYDHRFPATNILSLEEEKKGNFWLAKHQSRDGQGFTLDLKCSRKVSIVFLKNTHNFKSRDRATKRFELQGRRSTSDSWVVMMDKELEDSRSQNPPPVLFLPLNQTQVVRFIRFKLKDYWGKGGGLQYFGVKTGTII